MKKLDIDRARALLHAGLALQGEREQIGALLDELEAARKVVAAVEFSGLIDEVPPVNTTEAVIRSALAAYDKVAS